MNKNLEIIVKGHAGTGKTSIAVIVEKALRDAGFVNIKNKDIDISDSIKETVVQDIAEQRRGDWLKEAAITIDTVQYHRNYNEN